MKKKLGETAENRRTSKSDSAFRTISEAASELGLQQHVLRFWESRFSQIKPLKRAGGRRYYRPEDLEMLAAIRSLLHDQGYTIKGVQKLIAQNNGHLPVGDAPDAFPVDPEMPPATIAHQAPVDAIGPRDRTALENVLRELESLQSLLQATRQNSGGNP
ncbi:MerR family transcriptional regulator [Thalassospira sp.]|uniref:MerR family transcriptional regulator n=1 Tax=Thalassospira sp. TaxID=1912094 RepID=UPI002734A733|nr:MerR family transcriptional regulator [Thalassospira sp.]MDP2697879.1 MerR family transcriptional regulator [Thalassospira sp.]